MSVHSLWDRLFDIEDIFRNIFRTYLPQHLPHQSSATSSAALPCLPLLPNIHRPSTIEPIPVPPRLSVLPPASFTPPSSSASLPFIPILVQGQLVESCDSSSAPPPSFALPPSWSPSSALTVLSPLPLHRALNPFPLLFRPEGSNAVLSGPPRPPIFAKTIGICRQCYNC